MAHPEARAGGGRARRLPGVAHLDGPARFRSSCCAPRKRARGPIVKLPTMGGSVPLFMIENILHAPTITVPIANHDNNQHSFNENIRIQNLWDGIELMAALLAM